MIITKLFSKAFLSGVGIVLCLAINPAYAEDGLTPGPGLFSGNNGEIDVGKLIKKVSSTNAAGNSTKSAELKDEFQQFKLWQQAKADNSQQYQEFVQWLKYQAYLQSK